MNKQHLNFGMYITSRDDEREYAQLCISWRNTSKYFKIPNIIKPKIITVANHYRPEQYGSVRQELIEQRYGFQIYEEYCWIMYGNHTHDSSTEQHLSFNLGWRDHTFVRWSAYDTDHQFVEHFELKGIKKWDMKDVDTIRDNLPKVQIRFNDYDGEEIIATCNIEEREWHIGRGLWAWLKYFNKPLIVRVIEIEFNKETGKRKGSWKGGTIGCSEIIAPSESIFDSFSRYAKKNNFTNLKEIYKGVVVKPPRQISDYEPKAECAMEKRK